MTAAGEASAAVPTVVCDSDVMFDPFRRYLLLSLVVARVLTIRWSDALLDEWTGVIVREGRTTPGQAARQRQKLAADFPEAQVVPDLAHLVVGRRLARDPGDAHVAACALAAAPCVLLTYDLGGFDRPGLRPEGVDVRKPGPWLAEAFGAAPPEVRRDWLAGLQAHRESMSRPPYGLDGYLDLAAARQLAAFAHAVRAALSAPR